MEFGILVKGELVKWAFIEIGIDGVGSRQMGITDSPSILLLAKFIFSKLSNTLSFNILISGIWF